MDNLLQIKDLYANAGNKQILKGLNLTINKGEIHVIMGPNGSGKSNFIHAIAFMKNNTDTILVDFKRNACFPFGLK